LEEEEELTVGSLREGNCLRREPVERCADNTCLTVLPPGDEKSSEGGNSGRDEHHHSPDLDDDLVLLISRLSSCYQGWWLSTRERLESPPPLPSRTIFS